MTPKNELLGVFAEQLRRKEERHQKELQAERRKHEEEIKKLREIQADSEKQLRKFADIIAKLEKEKLKLKEDNEILKKSLRDLEIIKKPKK